MSLPYEQIEQIASDTRASVIMAGYDISKCVWEMSPSIWQTICRHFQDHCTDAIGDPTGKQRNSFMGIPLRRGVTDESTGILLKMVNLNPFQ